MERLDVTGWAGVNRGPFEHPDGLEAFDSSEHRSPNCYVYRERFRNLLEVPVSGRSKHLPAPHEKEMAPGIHM
ncbi:MAG: hypothetical protein OEY21_05455, partial [Nitrospira sp.]|nr:hypothetical protein [Nitrospira sp.]